MNNAAGRSPRRTSAASGRRSLVVALAAALMLTSCTADDPAPQPLSSSSVTVDLATFTFGAAADPQTLDPALANDTESYRVTRQVMETLVGIDPLTSEPTPLLAESWEESDDGRTYEFTLREDVLFQDGQPFDAAAVCANFERWYSLPPAAQQDTPRLPFENVFRAFSDQPDLSLYEGCTVSSRYTLTLQLSRRMTSLVPALAAPAFAIGSPAALAADGAGKLSRNGARFAKAPIGTGPFELVSWESGEVQLDSFDDYWGEHGDVDHVVFTTIADAGSRARALTAGRIDGYDFVSVDSAVDLARNGLQFLQRDPYSVLYLGMNQDFPGVDDPLFRQAVAHAIDKSALIEGRFLEGTKSARQFLPEKLGIGNETVTDYGYDPARARKLLKEAGYDGRELPFYYPRNVSRPYLPSPEKTYAELSRQLVAAGFNIRPVPIDWSEGYVDAVQQPGDRAFHLLGWSGTYQDPDNFIGSLFGGYNDEFAYDDPQLVSKIIRARSLPAGQERADAYADISSQLSDRLPAVPLALPISALAMSPRVLSYPVSPLMHEVFNRIDLADVEPDRTPFG